MRLARLTSRGSLALIALAVGVLGFWAAEPWSLHLMPQAGLAALAAAVLCAVLRLWPASGGFLLAGAAALAPVAPLYFPHGTPPRPGCTLSVVSFNMLENPPEFEGAARLLARLHPDIIFAQKVYGTERLRDLLLAAGLAGYYSFPSAQKPDLILSRFPITRTVEDTTGIWADIRVEGRTVTLKNMYMTRPNHDWAGYLGDHQRLRAWVSAHRGPLILSGDANTTPFTPEIRALEALLTDAWRERGFGLGATFPAPWRLMGRLGPFLRIDYIFHDSTFDAVAARRVDDATGAGHYPVWAELVFAGAGQAGSPCE